MNTILMLILSILLSAGLVWALIPILTRMKFGQPIREEGNKDHYKKQGTPTMGGIAFLLAFFLVSIISIKFDLSLFYILITTFAFGAIGFIDDYEKIAKKENEGLNEKQKLVLQISVSLILTVLMYFTLNVRIYEIDIPFISRAFNIGILAIPLIDFIMVGTTNAVNITDGLDGLLSSVSIPVFIGIFIIALPFNISVALSALVFAGVLLGFLIFNSNPASIFMGDTGSMAIGGAIVAMMIIINKPLYLIFIGGVYMMETLSVIIQRIYFKSTGGKRIFKMSPIHHHFELEGHKETKIVASFMVLSIILTLFTMYII